MGENAGVPNTTDDGFPDGEEDGSSGFAFVLEERPAVVGLSEPKELLATGSEEKSGLVASLVLVLVDTAVVASDLLFTFDGRGCSSDPSSESSAMNSESPFEMAEVLRCDILLIKP